MQLRFFSQFYPRFQSKINFPWLYSLSDWMIVTIKFLIPRVVKILLKYYISRFISINDGHVDFCGIDFQIWYAAIATINRLLFFLFFSSLSGKRPGKHVVMRAVGRWERVQGVMKKYVSDPAGFAAWFPYSPSGLTRGANIFQLRVGPTLFSLPTISHTISLASHLD